MAEATSEPQIKQTLSLTGLTVNAMALIAPGAFLWTTFQLQASQSAGGASSYGEMWTGLAFTIIVALLTAVSYSELANVYPHAGAGSSYFFAEAAFLDREKEHHRQFARIAKFLIGWISHLYYWIYPGIMVAFSATLVVYVLAVLNVSVTEGEEIAIAIAFAVLNGYVAFRGISGSTMTAIVINVVQIVALVTFGVLAIVFRLTHGGADYQYGTNVAHILLPHSFTNLIYQSTIAILLLVGFESVTALGAEAINPKKDVRRAIILSLAIQGLICYLFEYFAANFLVNDHITSTDATGATVKGFDAAAASAAPMGDMVKSIGDIMLGGIGEVMLLIFAVTVILALIGTTLACLNTGVRITYAMGRDREMPSILGLLHGKYATPHYGVWILVAVSAAFGAYGVINVDNLTKITLASNTGTFFVYGLTNLIALLAFMGRPSNQIITHKVVPLLGFVANMAMFGGVIYLAVNAGGASSKDAYGALAMVGVWMIAGVVWFIVNTMRQGHSILVQGASAP